MYKNLFYRPDIVHIWNDENKQIQGIAHPAQIVLDTVSTITKQVKSVSAQPSRVVTDWVVNQLNPAYWKPNEEITVRHNNYHQ